MRRFLDARVLHRQNFGDGTPAILNKAAEVAKAANLDGALVNADAWLWVQERAVGVPTWADVDIVGEPLPRDIELVSWAAGLMASKADDVEPTSILNMTEREFVAEVYELLGFEAGDTCQSVVASLKAQLIPVKPTTMPNDAPTTSAPVEDRDEIYRRLRLANDRAEAALNALESAVGVIRMLRGGDDA